MRRPLATLTLLRALRRLIGAALWFFIEAHIARSMASECRDRMAPDRAAGLQ